MLTPCSGQRNAKRDMYLGLQTPVQHIAFGPMPTVPTSLPYKIL